MGPNNTIILHFKWHKFIGTYGENTSLKSTRNDCSHRIDVSCVLAACFGFWSDH